MHEVYNVVVLNSEYINCDALTLLVGWHEGHPDSQDFQPMCHDPPTSHTDEQMTCDSKTALCTVVDRTVKTEWWGAGMVICLGQGADLDIGHLMPLSLCFLLQLVKYIQICFTFLVLTHPGSRGQSAGKWVLLLIIFLYPASFAL